MTKRPNADALLSSTPADPVQVLVDGLLAQEIANLRDEHQNDQAVLGIYLDRLAEAEHKLQCLDRWADVMREGLSRLRPMLRLALANPDVVVGGAETIANAQRDLRDCIDYLSKLHPEDDPAHA